MTDREPIQLVLITGVSGAGKSSAMNALEDLGYYCIDNLPVSLLRPLLAAPKEHLAGSHRVAIVTDSRAPGLVDDLPELLRGIDRSRIEPFLLFLDTTDEVLVRRYSETRRKHPLAGDGLVIDGIRREREMLTELRGLADRVMVTSEWTVHDMRAEVVREFGGGQDSVRGPQISLVSFGFKRGIPYGADLMFDVRFLPNPYFSEELRPLSGMDEPVHDFLESKEEYRELRERLLDLLGFLLPRFERENRAYLTVAIGCTGGRHRSVRLVEDLHAALAAEDWTVRISHRDVHR